MSTRRILWLSGTVLLLFALCTVAPAAKPKERKVTLDFKSATIQEALRAVLKGTNDSLTIAPGAMVSQKISVNLKAVEVSKAMEVVCKSAGLLCERSKEGIWLVVAPQPTIKVGKQQVPIVGVIQTQQAAGNTVNPEVVYDTSLQAVNRAQLYSANAVQNISQPPPGPLSEAEVVDYPNLRTKLYKWPSGETRVYAYDEASANQAPAPTQRQATAQRRPDQRGLFPTQSRQRVSYPVLNNQLASLEVTNVTLREAIQKLRESSGNDVMVHPAVPEGIRITAHVYLVSFSDLLNDLADETKLEVQVQVVDQEGKFVSEQAAMPPNDIKQAHYHYQYFFVPEPVIGPEAGMVVLIRTMPSQWPGAWSDTFAPDLVDVTAIKVPIREAVAKLRTASGYDVVVNDAVPAPLKVTIKAYRVSAYWIIQALVYQTGLEVRSQQVTATGQPIPANASSDEWKNSHTRYTIVPQSQLQVIGAAQKQTSPIITELTQLPRSYTITPFSMPRGPVQLDPNSGIVGFLHYGTNHETAFAFAR